MKKAPLKSKKKKSNFSHLFMGFILFLHILVLVAFVFSLLAGVIPTDQVWVFSFFALIYLPLYIVNVGFTALWIVMRRKFWLLSIIPLVLGFMIFRAHFNIHFSDNYTKTKEDIKVMTFNVCEFNHKEGLNHDEYMQKAFALIKNENPDIICFQDYTLPFEGKYSVEGLQKLLKLPYSANRNYSVYSDNISVNGVGILSRYPVVATQPIAVDSGYTCISADVLYRNQKIRIISIHLQSYALFKDEKVILSAPRTFTNFDEQRIKKDSRKIAWKLKWALRHRAPEARKVADFVRSTPYPVILCGDFNDTPASYVYRTISKTLEDPFLTNGSGIAKTYNESKYPFRIDYILHSKQFKSLNYNIISTKVSDHNPVTAVLKME
jgi:endonuclease/exonuclease/phosphatase family metal-dependent hydrolase